MKEKRREDIMAKFATSLNPDGQLPTVNQLCHQHLLITGQTGSGKTTTTLALLSQLQQEQSTAIVFDPTGEYAKLPNAVVYRLGQNAYLDIGMLSSNQLADFFKLPSGAEMIVNHASNALKIMKNLWGVNHVYHKQNVSVTKYQHEINQLGAWAQSYPIELLPAQIIEELIIPFPDSRANYHVLGQKYDHEAINHWWPTINSMRETTADPAFGQLFGTKSQGRSLSELNFVLRMFLTQHSKHKTLVIDLSALKNYVSWQRIVISVLFQQVLNYRLQHPQSLPVHLVIDEAHRYLPDGDSLTENGIFQVAREGRKYHLSLVLTTQSPLDLPGRLRSQFANLIVHRLADQGETQCLNLGNMATDELAVGQAVIKNGLEKAERVQVNLPQWWKKEA